NPILDHPDELHACWAVEAAAVARRANCARRSGNPDIPRWFDPLGPIYLCQDEKPIFDPPLFATSGRCVTLLKTCRSQPGAPRAPSLGTRRVQPDPRHS